MAFDMIPTFRFFIFTCNSLLLMWYTIIKVTKLFIQVVLKLNSNINNPTPYTKYYLFLIYHSCIAYKSILVYSICAN